MVNIRRFQRSDSVDSRVTSSPPKTEEDQVDLGAQELTVLPTLPLLGWVHGENISDISMEFHMTVRTKIERLTERQASMLLMVLVVRAFYQGVDLSLYIAMEFLRNVLVKNGHDLLETRSEKIRQTLMLSETIASYIRGDWINLRDYEQLPDEVREKIWHTGWMPNDRTIQSWKRYWQPEKFIEIRIVPVEHLLERTDRSTEPYSGYTKGYGNDGSPESPQKTRFSSELDGDVGEPDPPRFNLLDFDKYNDLLLAIERAKSQKRQKK